MNLISSEMKTDIEIARSIEMRRITEIAASIGIPEENVSQYGHYMAKVPADLIDPEKVAKSKLVNYILSADLPCTDAPTRRA